MRIGHYNPHGPKGEEQLEPEVCAEPIEELLSSAIKDVAALMQELQQR